MVQLSHVKHLQEETVDNLGNTTMQLVPCRIEVSLPHNDWDKTWSFVRLKGLESTSVTFLWRMVHNILPTRARLHHLHMPNIESPNCLTCNVPDSIEHHLALCPESIEVFNWLLLSLQNLCQDITMERVFLLDFPQLNAFPFVWLTANVLQKIWNIRQKGKRAQKYEVRAEIEAKINLLRKSRYGEITTTISTMII